MMVEGRSVGHRQLVPDLGRFISRDPIGFQGGLNLFNGHSTSPVTMVDPTGLDALFVMAGSMQHNPIGHSALALSGRGIWNRGFPGDSIRLGEYGVTDYIESQLQLRDVTLYRVKTERWQDNLMEGHLNSIDPTVDGLDDKWRFLQGQTCNEPPTRALEKGLVIPPLNLLNSLKPVVGYPMSADGAAARELDRFPPVTAARLTPFADEIIHLPKGSKLTKETRAMLGSFEPYAGPPCPKR